LRLRAPKSRPSATSFQIGRRARRNGLCPEGSRANRLSKSETHFEELCQRDDLDLVYIATPWTGTRAWPFTHGANGKHAVIEVPAAMTLEKCWQLVNTAELTPHHCMMLENCCYGEIELSCCACAPRRFWGSDSRRAVTSTKLESTSWRFKRCRMAAGSSRPERQPLPDSWIGPVAQTWNQHRRQVRYTCLDGSRDVLSQL